MRFDRIIFGVNMAEEVHFGDPLGTTGGLRHDEWARPFIMLGTSALSLSAYEGHLWVSCIWHPKGEVPELEIHLKVGPAEGEYTEAYMLQVGVLAYERLVAHTRPYTMFVEVPDEGQGAWWAGMDKGAVN